MIPLMIMTERKTCRYKERVVGNGIRLDEPRTCGLGTSQESKASLRNIVFSNLIPDILIQVNLTRCKAERRKKNATSVIRRFQNNT